jgi:hypothetical protein
MKNKDKKRKEDLERLANFADYGIINISVRLQPSLITDYEKHGM